jgi:hypothetical protein
MITIHLMDLFYVIMFCIVFSFIIHIEIQVKELKTMMQEHVKCDSELKGVCETDVISKRLSKE